MKVFILNKKFKYSPVKKGPWKVFSMSKDGCAPFLVSRKKVFEGQRTFRSLSGAVLKCSKINVYWWIGFKEGFKRGWVHARS